MSDEKSLRDSSEDEAPTSATEISEISKQLHEVSKALSWMFVLIGVLGLSTIMTLVFITLSI